MKAALKLFKKSLANEVIQPTGNPIEPDVFLTDLETDFIIFYRSAIMKIRQYMSELKELQDSVGDNIDRFSDIENSEFSSQTEEIICDLDSDLLLKVDDKKKCIIM